MTSVLTFALVFGGVGALFFLFFLVKTIVSPKKIMSVVRMLEGGNTKGAIRQAKTLLSRNGRNLDAHWLLGECYRMENRPELSLVEYRFIVNNGRYTALATQRKVRERLAEEYMKIGHVDEAQKEYILLSKLEPKNPDYYFHIARLFEDRNFSDSALTNYRKVVDLNPRHAESHHRMGIILLQKQQVGEAKAAFQNALTLDPDLHAAHYYLGKISKVSGDSNAALNQFERAAKDPDLRQRALLERANLLLAKGDVQHARDDLIRALQVGGEEGRVILSIRYLLARCHELDKELMKAIEQWEWIYRKNPKFGDVAEKLANYSDLRADDRLKDFLTASQQAFQEYCTRIVSSLGLSIQDVFMKNPDLIEMNALETQSKWRNAKKTPSLIRVFRGADPVSYESIRGLYDQMRKANANRSICITASKFTRKAVEFAQIRPIDLIDKDDLTKLLQKVMS